MMYQLIMAQKKAKEAALMSMVPGMKASQKYEYDSVISDVLCWCSHSYL
jgi:hypothetical protein